MNKDIATLCEAIYRYDEKYKSFPESVNMSVSCYNRIINDPDKSTKKYVLGVPIVIDDSIKEFLLK